MPILLTTRNKKELAAGKIIGQQHRRLTQGVSQEYLLTYLRLGREEDIMSNPRADYLPIVDRRPLKLPDNARVAVWVIINVEEWDINARWLVR